MKLVFFNNSLNHHQVNVADEFYKLLGDDYAYVATVAKNKAGLKGGIDYSSRSYCIIAGDSMESRLRALKLAKEAEVCVFGAESLDYAIERAKYKPSALSFELSERWLKRGWINVLSPRLIRWWIAYQRYFRKANFYKLNASAFAANDHIKLFTYKERMFKWGYFTKVDMNYEVEASNSGDSCSEITPLMWCARFLKIKHPELPVLLAVRLKAKGYRFVIDMFGNGEELEKTKKLISDLRVEDCVNLCGNRPNEEILKEMRKHKIFLFTSDQNEGWGAVTNEAMSNGCCLVGSNTIGSIPYLVKDGENGLIYKSCDLGSLFLKVEGVLNDEQYLESISHQAIQDMQHIWSPQNASKRLLTLVEAINRKEETPFADGPCSKAEPINPKNVWK